MPVASRKKNGNREDAERHDLEGFRRLIWESPRSCIGVVFPGGSDVCNDRPGECPFDHDDIEYGMTVVRSNIMTAWCVAKRVIGRK